MDQLSELPLGSDVAMPLKLAPSSVNKWQANSVISAQKSAARFDAPKVAILLCTYHGQLHLAEQLDSFAAQTHRHWRVWASDDGSADDTHAILDAYKTTWGEQKLSIHAGPADGFAANFLSLTCNPSIDADFFAFSDQDDIWEADRLSRALVWLTEVSPDIPALYCSRTRYISREGEECGFSSLFLKQPSFRNALVQSIAGGNTMVFNQAARELLAQTPGNLAIVSHDWWAYMLVTGCGGRVFYDTYAGVRYRQHGDNIAGQNVTLTARIKRIKALLTGRFKHWNEINLKALHGVRHLLTEENREALDVFSSARKQALPQRITNLYRSGVYRQTTLGNVGLLVAALLNKL